MPNVVTIVHGLLSSPEGESVLRQDISVLRAITQQSTITRVSALPNIPTPEAVMLGMEPFEGQMAQGALTIAALGADPPDRSVHFHVSVMGCVDGVGLTVDVLPTEDEARSLLSAVKQLNTKAITLVVGDPLDHGLVWEGLGEFRTAAPTAVYGSSIHEHLPEGDAEVAIRRYIDDSVNLLDGLELNERRRDAGRIPLNLLWPWGQGVRPRVPNMALRRGAPVLVESGSLRAAGLARLVGYRHGQRNQLGSGVRTQFSSLSQGSPDGLDRIVSLQAPTDVEERDWFLRQLVRRWIEPMTEIARLDDERFSLLLLGDNAVGLGFTFDGNRPVSTDLPFDERLIEESSVPVLDVNSLVRTGLN